MGVGGKKLLPPYARGAMVCVCEGGGNCLGEAGYNREGVWGGALCLLGLGGSST